jgi:Ran GTPase-activating protein (RanGAP) involved in mRNA processing and transport
MAERAESGNPPSNNGASISIISEPEVTEQKSVKISRLVAGEQFIPKLKLLVTSRRLKTLDLDCGASCMEVVQTVRDVLLKTKRLKQLTLFDCDFSPELFNIVAEGLMQSNRLVSLVLTCNNVAAECTPCLAQALAQNTSLQRLSLFRWPITDEGAEALGNGIAANTRLKRLTVGECSLKHPQIYIKLLNKSNTLQNLDLKSCKIGPEEACALAEALGHNTSIKTLDLSLNTIGKEGAQAIAKMLRKNTCMESLYLGQTSIPDAGFSSIGLALAKNKSLLLLDLTVKELRKESGKHICTAGMKGIAKGLTQNQTLRTLILRGALTLMGRPEFLHDFSVALARNNTLRHLDLSDNFIPSEVLKVLFTHALGRECSLQYVDLVDDSICDFEAICRSLAVNTSLLVLRMRLNVKPQSVEDMSHLLKHNTTLQRLDLGIKFGKSCTQMLLLSGLKHNTTLKRLAVTYENDGYDTQELHNLISTQLNVSVKTLLRGVTAQELVMSLGKVLKDCPRYHRYDLVAGRDRFDRSYDNLEENYDNNTMRKALDLPPMAADSDSNQRRNMLGSIRANHFDKCFAFVMGHHARLGEKSAVQSLSLDSVTGIVARYFGVSAEIFGTLSKAEYVRVVKDLEVMRRPEWLQRGH